MFKRILVPVDGSPPSRLGLREAVKIAKDQKATLYLLHVLDQRVITQGLDGMTYLSAEYVDEYIAALRKEGKAILAKAGAQVRKHRIKCQTALVETIGKPVAEAIIDQARKCRADLIILGTHGRRGLTRIVLGSDAEGVVRAARVPVLLMRAPAPRRTAGRRSRS